jgi:tRNA-specific 2-thiouridylase
LIAEICRKSIIEYVSRQIRQRKNVYVGLSGGVDSSVSALLLKQAGYEVVGVFIKVWQPDWITCTWKEDRLDAMRVCARLDIPFMDLDLEKEYKREVVDYMIREYRVGRTPNPDVMCNKYVKFGAFYDWARKQGADFVATGHYAQIKNQGNYIYLAKAVDTEKDQTYFLYNIKKGQLLHTLFPIGHLKKPSVRKLAKKFGLITATKKDSQGLCFIGKIDMREFLSHYIPEKKGKVFDVGGDVIGTHEGAFYYTIGQRHGFLITKKGTNDKPLYVVKKELDKNVITVGEELLVSDANSTSLKANLVNWCGTTPKVGAHVFARIRYRQPLEKCEIVRLSTSSLELHFERPQKAITSGQAVVLYDKERCLGGGIIE